MSEKVPTLQDIVRAITEYEVYNRGEPNAVILRYALSLPEIAPAEMALSIVSDCERCRVCSQIAGKALSDLRAAVAEIKKVE